MGKPLKYDVWFWYEKYDETKTPTGFTVDLADVIAKRLAK
jgi:hypothetical protein